MSDLKNKLQHIQGSLNEYGQVFVDIRNFCNVKCNNLTDTHEVTLAEKSCFFNCFKKMNYGYSAFNKVTNDEFNKIVNSSFGNSTSSDE